MSLVQAEQLMSLIKSTMYRTKIQIRRLDGNEYVIYLSSRQVFIWNFADWCNWYESYTAKQQKGAA